MEAIYLLARAGFHYEAMELIRSNAEALDLIILFLQEPPDNPLMKKWFEGEIVPNSKARAAFEAFYANLDPAQSIALPIRLMKSDIYTAFLHTRMSLSPHCLTRMIHTVRTSTLTESLAMTT